MINDVNQIENLILDITSVIDRHLNIYLIGGGAMMFLGSKEYTKDLDLVVTC